MNPIESLKLFLESIKNFVAHFWVHTESIKNLSKFLRSIVRSFESMLVSLSSGESLWVHQIFLSPKNWTNFFLLWVLNSKLQQKCPTLRHFLNNTDYSTTWPREHFGNRECWSNIYNDGSWVTILQPVLFLTLSKMP